MEAVKVVRKALSVPIWAVNVDSWPARLVTQAMSGKRITKATNNIKAQGAQATRIKGVRSHRRLLNLTYGTKTWKLNKPQNV